MQVKTPARTGQNVLLPSPEYILMMHIIRQIELHMRIFENSGVRIHLGRIRKDIRDAQNAKWRE